MNGSFTSISEMFKTLNNSGVKYVVLRNYINLLEEDLYQDGHGDIDVLCEDSAEFAIAIGAESFKDKVRKVCNDGVHYFIILDGREVKIDARHLRDGYYCEKWQRDMLERRVEYKGFYVMSEEDYFYSLIYHAILQKPFLSDEYRFRLCEMSYSLGVESGSGDSSSFMLLLDSYMKRNDYRYVFPKDVFVPLHFGRIPDRRLLRVDFVLALRHLLFDIKVGSVNLLVKLKHLMAK